MILFALGAACMVASIGGAAVTLSGGGKVAEKDTLHTCFTRARLFIRQKSDKDWVYTYPSVNGHEVFDDRQEYTFTLPIGVDPERVYKYLWVFKQGFGQNIDIEGYSAEFILRVYKSPIGEFNYEIDKIPLEGHKLPVVIGRTRREWIVYDMVLHPHLLFAGETGSGKSTALRAMIVTWLKLGINMELYLADLKRSEFHLFKSHADKVVNDAEGLMEILNYISIEMERRGDLCDRYGVANVIDLPEPPPFIILVIDEVAILKKNKDVMAGIAKITAIGRSLSCFACLSLQRPDSQVLDSTLKSNLTVRVGFKHEDAINSRITLGCDGAEMLVGPGRGLIKMDGLKEFQSPFLSLMDAKQLLKKS